MLYKACLLLLVLTVDAQVTASRYYESYTATPERTETNNDGATTSHPSGVEDDRSTAALEEFLKNYEVERPRNHRYYSGNRWDLMQTQKYNSHPYDDKKGWVSLEPVPWSVSKISKWHSRYKPQENTNFDFDFNNKKPYKQRPPPSTYHYQQSYNDFPADEDDVIEVEDNDSYYNRRPKPKPKPVISSFAQKLHIKNTISDSDYASDIITDGMPSNFPEHHQDHHYNNYNRRQSVTTEPSHHQQASHPFRGDVLPPLKGSNVNMTTSHGGLLQVDANFQTVEQAAQKFKRQKQKPKQQRVSTTTTTTTTTTTRRPPRTGKPLSVKRKEASATVTTRNNAPDTSAVLAAVGAGMIPATMAMLLPMAMGGRKKRQTRSVTGRPTIVEITLPRSL